jgi:CBS domain-containing protein
MPAAPRSISLWRMSLDQTVSGSNRVPAIGPARVEDVMRPGVITCAPETPLREVAGVMATKHIHTLVVTSIDRRGDTPTWRILGGLDLVAAALDGLDGRTAGELATAEPITVSDESRLEDAAQLMVDHLVDHLLVVGAHDGRPVGVLSSLDIAGVIARET